MEDENDDEIEIDLAARPLWQLAIVSVLMFWGAVGLGVYLTSCAPVHMPPIPPPPGPGFNDWSAAHAPDGGAPCMKMGVSEIEWDKAPDSSGVLHGRVRDVSGEPCDGGAR